MNQKNDDLYVYTKVQTQDILNIQFGGEHYKKLSIQPWEYISANKIGFFEGNIIKYVTRHPDKNGIEDLKKARHTLDYLIASMEAVECAKS